MYLNNEIDGGNAQYITAQLTSVTDPLSRMSMPMGRLWTHDRRGGRPPCGADTD